jgi:hypothetical protein
MSRIDCRVTNRDRHTHRRDPLMRGLNQNIKPAYRGGGLRITVGVMRSQDLSRQQLASMEQALLPALQYLHKLFRRTSHRNFPDDDPLRVACREAELSMQKLITELRTCRSGAPLPNNRAVDPHPGYRLGRPKHENY